VLGDGAAAAAAAGATTGYYHRLAPAVCDEGMMCHVDAAAEVNLGR
jgi:hypothetical protein